MLEKRGVALGSRIAVPWLNNVQKRNKRNPIKRRDHGASEEYPARARFAGNIFLSFISTASMAEEEVEAK